MQPVDVTLLDYGLVSYGGTADQKAGEWRGHTERREEARKSGLTETQRITEAVFRTTRVRKQLTKDLEKVEEDWRTAIREAVAAKLPVTDIARWAEISRERIYQIRDDRR